MTDVLDEYKNWRANLATELKEIDAEIARLHLKKHDIEEVLYGRLDVLPTEDSWAGRALAFVQVNPGASRAEIATGIEFDGSLNYLTNVLGTLKTQGRLRREGSKLHAVWFAIVNETE